MRNLRAGLLLCSALLTGAGAAAQPAGVWQGQEWGPPPIGPYGFPAFGDDPRIGKIDAAHFFGGPSASAELGHGTIIVRPQGGTFQPDDEQDLFEVAALGKLTKAGYSPATTSGQVGQELEIHVSHQLIAPPEPPHSPVSGAVSVGGAVGGGGYRGTGGGIAIAVDLSKPRGALVQTMVSARIIDSQTKEILWQGRASVVAPDNDRHWSGKALATRLTDAMFKGFPEAR